MRFFLATVFVVCAISATSADPEQLVDAVKDADMNKLESLLNNDPRFINALNKEGEAALHWAAINGNIEIMRFLIANDAEINIRTSDNWTPLHWAVLKNNVSTAEYLIQKGADINAVTRGGWTPLHVAAYKENTDAIGMLIDNGADLNRKDKNGNTPLETIVERAHSIMEIMIDGGAEVEDKPARSNSLFAWARRRSDKSKEQKELRDKINELNRQIKANESLQQKLTSELEASRREHNQLSDSFRERADAIREAKDQEIAVVRAQLKAAEERIAKQEGNVKQAHDALAERNRDQVTIEKLSQQLATEKESRLHLERSMASDRTEYEKRISELMSTITEINGKLKESELALLKNKAELDRTVTEKESLQDTMSASDQAESETTRKTVTGLTSQLNNALKRVAELEQNLADASSEKEALLEETEDLKKELENAHAKTVKADKTDKKPTPAANDKLAKELASAKESIKQLEQQIELQRKAAQEQSDTIYALEKDIKSRDATIKSLEKDLDSGQDLSAHLEKERELKKALLMQFEDQRETFARESEELRNSLDKKDSEIAELKEKLSKLQWGSMNAEARARELTEQVEQLKQQKNQYSANTNRLAQLTTQVKTQSDEIERLSGKLSEADQTMLELRKELSVARKMLSQKDQQLQSSPDPTDITALRSQITKLQKEIEEAESNSARLRKQLSIASIERSEAEIKLRRLAEKRMR